MSNKKLPEKLKLEVKGLTITYLRYLDGQLNVPLSKIAESFAVSKNTIYSWASKESSTTPSKGHFARLHALSFASPEALPLVLATIKSADDSHVTGPLFGMMVGAGLFTAIGGLGPLAGIALGAVAGPLGVLVGAGMAALVGRHMLTSRNSSATTIASPLLLEALKLDPSEPWSAIMAKVNEQNGQRPEFFSEAV